MLPILISVSLAPVSYFFCAKAAWPEARASVKPSGRLSKAVAKRRLIGLVIPELLVFWRPVRVERAGGFFNCIDTGEKNVRKKKPPGDGIAGGHGALKLTADGSSRRRPR